MPNFVLIGVGGYVAKKHLEAIKHVKGNILAACDRSDSVGILDSYFPDTTFFTNPESFGNYCKEQAHAIDYFVVCTPNYLHANHCIQAMETGINVICEKPVVLTSESLDLVQEAERKTGKSVNVILQMRYALTPPKNQSKRAMINVIYHTPRGDWYHKSWKAHTGLSGGLSMNIGVHLFDWLLLHYGNVESVYISERSDVSRKGFLYLKRAVVEFDLSISRKHKPKRLIRIDLKQFDITEKFTRLHNYSYKQIINGKGFTTEDCRASIDLIGRIEEEQKYFEIAENRIYDGLWY